MAQELIGSLGFDAEQWRQVCVARPSEPLLHIFTVAGHRGNCHSSPSRRNRNKERGSKGSKERNKWAKEEEENYERIKIDSLLFTVFCFSSLKETKLKICISLSKVFLLTL